MRDRPTRSTLDPAPLIRGQLPGVSAADWREQGRHFLTMTPAEARAYAKRKNAESRDKAARDEAAHTRRIRNLSPHRAAAPHSTPPRATTPASTFGPSSYWRAHHAREAGAR